MTAGMIQNARITNVVVREFLAEFLGTFVLILFGDGVVAQVVLSNGTKGSFFTINWGWGVAVTLAILTTGKTHPFFVIPLFHKNTF